jgi:hypothetical protein
LIEVTVTDYSFYFNNIPTPAKSFRIMAFYSLLGIRKQIPQNKVQLGKVFSFQVISHYLLEGLAQMLNSVFTPFFITQCGTVPDQLAIDPLSSRIDPDFLSVCQKFVDEINHSVTKHRTVYNIQYPTFLQGDINQLIQNEKYIE